MDQDRCSFRLSLSHKSAALERTPTRSRTRRGPGRRGANRPLRRRRHRVAVGRFDNDEARSGTCATASPGGASETAVAATAAFHACGNSRRPSHGQRAVALGLTVRIDVAPGTVPARHAAAAVGGGRAAAGGEQARARLRLPRRGYVRAAARCRRPPSLTHDAAGIPPRPADVTAAAEIHGGLPWRHDRRRR
jgi:hypothetical protein